jgi:hypothetical protein
MKKKLLLPACLVMLSIGAYAQKSKTVPPPPPPPEPPKIEVIKFTPPVIVKDEETSKFLKRNPTVAGFHFKKSDKIALTLKDGSIEKYNLLDEAENKAFKAKYGEPPVAPPPPPPMEPKPAKKS